MYRSNTCKCSREESWLNPLFLSYFVHQTYVKKWVLLKKVNLHIGHHLLKEKVDGKWASWSSWCGFVWYDALERHLFIVWSRQSSLHSKSNTKHQLPPKTKISKTAEAEDWKLRLRVDWKAVFTAVYLYLINNSALAPAARPFFNVLSHQPHPSLSPKFRPHGDGC